MSASETHRPPAAPAAEGTRPAGVRTGARRLVNALSQGRASAWTALTALLVAAGVLGAVLGARAVARSDAEKARLAFHLASSETASTLKLAIQHEEDLVDGASSFMTDNPTASPADFDRWAQSAQAMKRYPELQNIGLVALVPASGLKSFEAHLAANPVRALGPEWAGPKGPLQVLPPGNRPYYCLAVAGLARSVSTYLPAGVDYCALAPALISGRDSGVASYAPVMRASTTALGVSTPVYRGGVVPRTTSGRRRAFVGWLGELLEPQVVLSRALEGHPNLAVSFSYELGRSHVVFHSGRVTAGAQTAAINLRNGWTVATFGPALAGGVFADSYALALLIGGTLLSVMLGLLMFILTTGRRRALSLVHEKTRELSHQALHDNLTGLPNRALVLDRAEQLLARAARQPGMMAGALFIDIDGFKHVNDNLGHAAGDQLLRVVGERLQGAVREQDTVGRHGGDEFVVLFEATPDEETLYMLADRLTEVLREPVELADGRKIYSVTASIGVAAGKHATPDALLRDADLALYAAKAAGKDRYALFEANMYSGLEGRLELEKDLSAALQQEQFFLLYQPIFDLASRELVSVEALIRWQHPTRGVVAPDSFIPLAEESGLIVPIGRWVLDEACRQAAAWAERGIQIDVSVNVSAYQLGRRDFAEDVRQAIGRSGVESSSLTLELTETTVMRHLPAACERLEEVKALGVRVAIDDFGTGYASLSYLQRIPVDVLKVDKSFVAALSEGGQGRALLQAILGVGRALSLAVVAEGIEEPGQLSALEEIGCELAQGFFMGKPCRPEAIDNLLSSRRRVVGSRAA
jgi:diguanylate cyclase (GGDEF)-like protein